MNGSCPPPTPRGRRQSGATPRNWRSAAVQLAALQARYDAALAENAAARAAFERQTADAASALERVSRERIADAAAAAGQIASIEAKLGARLAEAAAASTALEHTLTDAQSAQQQAVEDLASAAARQVALEDRLAQETDRGLGLERQLVRRRYGAPGGRAAAHLGTGGRCGAARLASDAIRRRAGRKRRCPRRIRAADGGGGCRAHRARTHAGRRAIRAAAGQSEDLASAAARQAALEDRLAQETDRGLGLERQLSAADTARQDADRRHASELADAAAQLASLQTRYDTAVHGTRCRAGGSRSNG